MPSNYIEGKINKVKDETIIREVSIRERNKNIVIYVQQSELINIFLDISRVIL